MLDHMDSEIDWPALREAAVGAMRHAYAPYSNFPVGAAALVDDGRIVVGCNVENASYGIGLCAECGLVSALHASGGGRLVAMACVDVNGAPLMPCGRCRQLLWEHGGPDCLIDHVDGPEPMASLLPYAFDDTDLAKAPRPSNPGTAVPARLALLAGTGTVFVHPDVVGGSQVWTAYWERSSKFGADPDEPTGILEEGPSWPRVDDAVAWGRARTPRVVVVDAAGQTAWAGTDGRPAGIEKDWAQ
jgi:cytidine deaminase